MGEFIEGIHVLCSSPFVRRMHTPVFFQYFFFKDAFPANWYHDWISLNIHPFQGNFYLSRFYVRLSYYWLNFALLRVSIAL